MNKIVKFVVPPLLGIVAVVAGLLVYIVVTFDPNQYKPQIIQAIKDQTQRTIRLEGDITLSLFPGIGATLGKIWLSERTGDQEFAGAEDIRIALKLLPLLSKRVVIDTVEIRNLRVNVVRSKDGRMNIDDLTGADQLGPAANTGPGGIDIDHFVLRNATITYTDQAKGGKYVMSKLDLEVGPLANLVPSNITSSFAIQSDQPALNLDITLKTNLTFDFEHQNYSLHGLALSAKGLAIGIDNLVATASGDLEARMSSDELMITKLMFAARGKQDQGELDVKFEMPRANLSKGNASSDRITLDVALTHAKRKLTAKLDIPGIEGNARSFTAEQLNVDLDLQQEGATAKFKLSGPLTGSVEAQRIELTKLVANINIKNPRLTRNPIDATLKGKVLADLVKQHANLTFATKIDDSNINGKAVITRFSPPFYTFDIDIDQLDADRYLPEDTKQPKQMFDLSELKGLNVSGSLRIGMLKMGNVKASAVRIDIKPDNGRNDISAVAADPYRSFANGMRSQATLNIGVRHSADRLSADPAQLVFND